MSKKILSFALAVVMVVSMFAVSSSALAEGKTIGYRVVSDAKVGMKAGDTVNVKVYFTASGINIGLGNLSLGFDSTAYTPVDDGADANLSMDGIVFGESYFDYYKEVASTVNVIAQIATKMDDADKAKFGGDNAAGVQIQLAYQDASYKADGVITDADCELFTLKFKVNRELTADDIIGIPSSVYGQSFLRIQELATASYFDKSVVDFSEGDSVPAIVPIVTVVGAQSKWANGVAGQDYLFGYVGQIANFTPIEGADSKNGKEVTNIDSITATATINGNTVTSKVITIWKDGDVYKFRASFNGFEYNEATVIENIVFTVVTTDGTYSSSNYVANSDNVNAIYTASVANGLAAA